MGYDLAPRHLSYVLATQHAFNDSAPQHAKLMSLGNIYIASFRHSLSMILEDRKNWVSSLCISVSRRSIIVGYQYLFESINVYHHHYNFYGVKFTEGTNAVIDAIDKQYPIYIVSYWNVMFPSWFPVLLFGFYPIVAFYRGPLLRWRRGRKGYCKNCNYNLTGNESGVCPECGTEIKT